MSTLGMRTCACALRRLKGPRCAALRCGPCSYPTLPYQLILYPTISLFFPNPHENTSLQARLPGPSDVLVPSDLVRAFRCLRDRELGKGKDDGGGRTGLGWMGLGWDGLGSAEGM